MPGMTQGNARQLDSTRWMPVERLGQSTVDPQLRPRLIAQGLLTRHLKEACKDGFALRLVEQWNGPLDAAHKLALQVADSNGLFRDVQMYCGERVWVYAQTVMPDSTVYAHSWLGELGDSALGETLSDLPGVERGSYEYAWLTSEGALTARALRNMDMKPAGLWARRSRISLRGAPLLVHELFLPFVGRA
jgi:chorismate--pyruvate lyase